MRSWDFKIQMIIFKDRADAGKQLGEKLKGYIGPDKPIILALPRGGVPVAFEVSRALEVPFDVFVVEKIGAPGNPEFGIGAIAEGGVLVADANTLHTFHLSEDAFRVLATHEAIEVERRLSVYRANRPLPIIKDKIVVLVDDGLATGVTATAAVAALLLQNPAKIIFAAPVCAKMSANFANELRVEVVCLYKPEFFSSVGEWYEEFSQLTDEEVLSFLDRQTFKTNH